MSAFLGPIHYRMFDKACAVDAFARRIAAYSDAQGWTEDLATQVDSSCPRIEGEITDHVDLQNIHGSLSQLIEGPEAALDAVCSSLSSHLDDLVEFARGLGEEAGKNLNDDVSLQQIWSAIDGEWLDGMPCDGNVRFIENEEDSIIWQINLATHAQPGYTEIRMAWISGFAQAANVDLVVDGNTFSIRKGE